MIMPFFPDFRPNCAVPLFVLSGVDSIVPSGQKLLKRKRSPENGTSEFEIILFLPNYVSPLVFHHFRYGAFTTLRVGEHSYALFRLLIISATAPIVASSIEIGNHDFLTNQTEELCLCGYPQSLDGLPFEHSSSREISRPTMQTIPLRKSNRTVPTICFYPNSPLGQ